MTVWGLIEILNGDNTGDIIDFQFEALNLSLPKGSNMQETPMPGRNSGSGNWVSGKIQKPTFSLLFARTDTSIALEPIKEKLERLALRDDTLRDLATVMMVDGVNEMVVGKVSDAHMTSRELDLDGKMGRMEFSLEIWRSPVPPDGGGSADPI